MRNFTAYFVSVMHSQSASDTVSVRLTGYFSHETLLKRVMLGGVC
jgi:hypothetical protein